MSLGSLHLVDFAVILAYIVVVIWLGHRASKGQASQENFFLADRKLGKLYQFFLNFGNSTDANGAVSISSFVYQKGVSGVWLNLYQLFITPYYWFMNAWFRRVRLITVADLFVDRFGSRALTRFYAGFMCLATVILVIGFGNLIGYKITASLLLKPETQWTAEEQASVSDYRAFKALQSKLAETPQHFTPSDTARLDTLSERNAHGELRRTISWLDSPTGKWAYYLLYTLIVGSYIVMGGMSATAINESLQGILIVVFSVILIPFGLIHIGGWSALSQRVPAHAFDLIGDTVASIGLWELLALLFVGLIQINGIIGNMSVAGSAKDEMAARFGAVSGTYAKRVMTVLWAFCGLIAIAIYQGATQLSDPDSAWGSMALLLLKPGLLGLMMAGLLAANMSTIATQTMATAALFTRNIYLYMRPRTSEQRLLLVTRLVIALILATGIYVAAQMDNVYSVIQVALTSKVPFGATVLLIFFWRRLTAAAIWACLILSITLNILVPSLIGPKLTTLTHSPALTVRVEKDGMLQPVFFETVTRSDPSDPASPLVGSRRFHFELWVLDTLGLNVAALSPTRRNAARFFYSGLFPFAVLIGVSLVTRPPDRRRSDLFFGKMKTPVGATPALESAAMSETERSPARFDHTKLFGPHSNWEFTRWDRVDALGFCACLAVSGVILAGFWLLMSIAR